MSDDVETLAEATAELLAAQMKAQGNVIVALLSILVKQGILSVETVEAELLNGLEQTYQSIKPSDLSDDPGGERREVAMGLQLVRLIRSRLFPTDSDPS
jgi:hypothetical protein